jgi:hypothetical protein
MNSEAIKYLDLIIDDPKQIGLWLGFDNLKDIHNEWIKEMIFAKEDETTLAHRGSYKTTCVILAIGLIMILMPNDNIIFLRKTDDDVKEVIKQVAKILKSDVMQHIVKKIYCVDLKLVEESSFAVTTNLTTDVKGSSQLLGLGIKTSLTGKHANIIFTDDIVNMKDRISKPERDLIKMAYMELQNIKNRGGRIYNTGTPWHKEDAISSMPNVKTYNCYQTGLINRTELEEIRSKMTPSLFAANYELKHIAESESLFTNPAFSNDNELFMNGNSHIDASYGGNDGTSFTILKVHGETLYMFGKRWNKHVDDCLSEIYSYIEYFKSGSIYLEKNADKGYLDKQLIKDGKRTNSYNENMNKFIKISTYLRKYWNNIVWHEDTDPDYINEILDYTEQAEHDDSPDSAASIIRETKGKGNWLL